MICCDLLTSGYACKSIVWRYCEALAVSHGFVLTLLINKSGCLPGMGIPFVFPASSYDNQITLETK